MTSFIQVNILCGVKQKCLTASEGRSILAELSEKGAFAMLEDIAEVSLLYDFYGGLLTEKQSEFLRLYFEENYTLAEIAEDNGLSRQGVYDAVAKAQKKLVSFEEKLGLVARFRESEQLISEIDSEISSLAEEYKDNEELVEKLQLIRAKADHLGD